MIVSVFNSGIPVYIPKTSKSIICDLAERERERGRLPTLLRSTFMALS